MSELREENLRGVAAARGKAYEPGMPSKAERAEERVSAASKIRHVAVRAFHAFTRQRVEFAVRFLQPLFLALLCGAIFLNNSDDQNGALRRAAVGFTMIVFVAFSCIFSIPQVFRERPAYTREIASRTYSAAHFFIGRFIAELPLFVVQLFMFYPIVYFFGRFRAESGRFFAGLAMYWLALLTSSQFALSAANAAPTPEIATVLAVTMMSVFMLFSGTFLIPKNAIPRGWLWYFFLSYFQYALNFFLGNELLGREFDCPEARGAVPVPIGTDASCLAEPFSNGTCWRFFCPISSGDQFLASKDVDTDIWANFGYSALFFVGFSALAFVTQKYVKHVRR
jgi:ABC-type multidrug transport system permease subunit